MTGLEIEIAAFDKNIYLFQFHDTIYCNSNNKIQITDFEESVSDVNSKIEFQKEKKKIGG